MDQKDSGSVIYYAGFAGDNAPRAVFLGLQAHDARHHGRYGPEGQLCSGAHGQTAKTVESPQLQFQVVDISFAAQTRSLMVQTVRQTKTIAVHQLLYKVVDIPVVHDRADFPVVVQRSFPKVQTVCLTLVFPQFVLGKVIVVPVVQVERDPLVPSWRRLS